MCVVSMVMDHYRDRWEPWQHKPIINVAPPEPQISPEEVAEFKRLLERAREYDKQHNQADCELDEKKAALKAIAKALGVNIDFVDERP